MSPEEMKSDLDLINDQIKLLEELIQKKFGRRNIVPAQLSAAQAAKKDRAEEIAEKAIIRDSEFGNCLSSIDESKLWEFATRDESATPQQRAIIVDWLRLMESETAAKFQPVMRKTRVPTPEEYKSSKFLTWDESGGLGNTLIFDGMHWYTVELWPKQVHDCAISAWLPIPKLPAGGAK